MRVKKRKGKGWRPPRGCSAKVWWAWYSEYLDSKAWHRIRSRRIGIDGGRCLICGTDQDLRVHHLTYENVGREELDDLRTLCDACHLDQHDRAREIQAKEKVEQAAYNVAELQAHFHNGKKKRIVGPFVQDLTHRRRPGGLKVVA